MNKINNEITRSSKKPKRSFIESSVSAATILAIIIHSTISFIVYKCWEVLWDKIFKKWLKKSSEKVKDES